MAKQTSLSLIHFTLLSPQTAMSVKNKTPNPIGTSQNAHSQRSDETERKNLKRQQLKVSLFISRFYFLLSILAADVGSDSADSRVAANWIGRKRSKDAGRSFSRSSEIAL